MLFNLSGEFTRFPTNARIRAAVGGSAVRGPRGRRIRCPWHSWEYDIRTGKSVRPAPHSGAQVDVNVEPGAALVEGPYVAETFDVKVEDQIS